MGTCIVGCSASHATLQERQQEQFWHNFVQKQIMGPCRYIYCSGADRKQRSSMEVLSMTITRWMAGTTVIIRKT